MPPLIIHAPSSTKNESGERDLKMYQTGNGNQWYFGMTTLAECVAHSKRSNHYLRFVAARFLRTKLPPCSVRAQVGAKEQVRQPTQGTTRPFATETSAHVAAPPQSPRRRSTSA